ncbi:type II secretion system ATPase GspE [Desulfofustis glycolicus]|uniref:protein-secreting ATPase n=1 Tax=Desulfofustis glycolicus DSM 9705 TaxID=1121409 RepID=A0A1M5XZV1_9BACT|nr:type II secretion system ATPase GspE [Desulfofustis glycolicus]MCB2218268.1 type II secretion system ATPase GspE [Desulfobulbaceae bacterium]SHI05078.1 type II secretion system protein E (GspE) [Desulfofustis glycolicus DSM 9705]
MNDTVGRLLVERAGVPEEALQQAYAVQKKGGGKLGEILVRQKVLREMDLLQVLAEQFRMTVIPLLPTTIDTGFTKKLSIGFLKKNLLVPVITEDEVYIAVHDPFDFQALDEVRLQLDLPSCPAALSPHSEIIRTINSAYDLTLDTAEEVLQDIDEEDPDVLFSKIEEVGDLLDDTSHSPVIRLVNLMLSQAVRHNVSDIHIEPYQNSLKIRQRLDGLLYDMFTPPKHVQSALTSRIKLMARMNIAEKRLPQDGRIEIKVGNKDIDIRVSTLPTAFGERVVLRLLDKSTVRMSLTDLGMSPERLTLFSRIIKAPNGIVLVTGPTGSGKTTTLYAALSAINRVDINIITVEDPIEYRIPGIGQVQVNPKIDLTFASGLRSIVRQDPDVILIGEIRDLETAEIAIQSALTGHLVFSTLHTNDAPSTVTRLRDMGVESFLIASSINAILAQRLVRIICPACRESYEPDAQEIAGIGLTREMLKDTPVYRGRGCEECRNTGYRGRTGIHEFMIMNDELKRSILKTSDSSALRRQAQAGGMTTLLQDGAAKVLAGVTTIEEVFRVAQAQ